MPDAHDGVTQWLAQWADEKYAYLTTTGRRTGQPHRIEIWFAAAEGRVYLMSGGRDRSDWVRNLREHPEASVEIGDETHAGTARFIQPETHEDQFTRHLLVTKYHGSDDLNDWGRNSLPLVIEFEPVSSES